MGTEPEGRPGTESSQDRPDTASGEGHPGDDDNVRRGQGDGERPWWEGRRVAIRPDVPGPTFDPQDLVLIRTDEERVAAQAKINRSIDEMKDKSPEDRWPAWLWEADYDLASQQESRDKP